MSLILNYGVIDTTATGASLPVDASKAWTMDFYEVSCDCMDHRLPWTLVASRATDLIMANGPSMDHGYQHGFR